MQVSVILAHPDLQNLNHAIARAAAEELLHLGHAVLFHDLLAEGFNPLLQSGEIPDDAPIPGSVQMHCREIAHSGGIFAVHPDWWGQPPAI
jgi:NAD(P)H dehydrogenase (quinone)